MLKFLRCAPSADCLCADCFWIKGVMKSSSEYEQSKECLLCTKPNQFKLLEKENNKHGWNRLHSLVSLKCIFSLTKIKIKWGHLCILMKLTATKMLAHAISVDQRECGFKSLTKVNSFPDFPIKTGNGIIMRGSFLSAENLQKKVKLCRQIVAKLQLSTWNMKHEDPKEDDSTPWTQKCWHSDFLALKAE